VLRPNLRSRGGLNVDELESLIASEQSLFERLSSASFLMTGATGWFGVWLLDSLCAADDMLGLGLRITAVSRDPLRFLGRFPTFADDPRISWIKSDVRQFEFGRENFTHIIHGAADSAQPRGAQGVAESFGTIVQGTERVLEAAGSGCRGFLLISSGAVYGPNSTGQIAFVESEAGGPDSASVKNAYAEGKRAAEMMAAIRALRGAPISIARCFAFVGPHMPFDSHFAIGNFIADAVAGREIRVRSDGRPLRSYLYMTDLVRALLIILNRGSAGAAYNVGSEVAISIEQLAHTVNRVVGGRGVSIGGTPTHGTEHYVPNTTRLRLELNFEPIVTLETAISRTAAWYRAQGDYSLP
jgi:nucleoside-diphosphate-sugar epimerase